VYLDLLHWVGLSKARLGRPNSELYGEALLELREGVASGRIVIPLSFSHYIEVSQIADAQRRAGLALTMCELSKNVSLTAREILMFHELRCSLARELGVVYRVPRPLITGYGVAHAHGKTPLPGPLEDKPGAIEHLAADVGAFIPRLEAHTGYGWKFVPSGRSSSSIDLVREALDAHAQFRMLMGPANKQDPELLKLGFAPSRAYEVVDRITAREADLAATLAADPSWQRRLDDIIYARALFWDLSEEWDRAMSDVWPRVVTYEEFGIDRLHRIMQNMPIIDVESSIRYANFRAGSRKWTKNDIHDIGFAGVAVVYCQVVATDKHLAAQLQRQGLDKKYHTVILTRPEQLTEHLRAKINGPDA